jgi:hypothetical protein
MTKKTSPPAGGCRGVTDAYTRVDGPREAAIEIGMVEPTEAEDEHTPG